MARAFFVLFGAAFTIIVATALGRVLLRGLGLRLAREEERPLAFVTGAACLSLVVFLLAAAGQARLGVFLAVGCIAIGAMVWWHAKSNLDTSVEAPGKNAWATVVFAVFGALYLANAMAPEISPDGSAYHLSLVARYYDAHGFVRITTNIYANLSQGLEMLFLHAWAFGRHSAAALVHFAFLAAAVLAMLAYSRRFGLAQAGAAGALFFFVSPVVGVDGTAAYNDVAAACVLFAMFYLLEIWRLEQNDRLLIPAGLLAGFAYAIKYTAFVGLVYALGFVAWTALRSRRPLVRPVVVMTLCALAMMLPWMIKNAVWLENPFSPFFNAWFPNPYVHISFEKEYAYHMRHYEGLSSYRAIPLEVTVRGAALCGLVGPLFLLVPLALMALRHPAGRRLLLAGAIFGLPYFTNVGTRFLIPSLPFVSLALGMVLARWRLLVACVVLAHAVASWPGVVKMYCRPGTWRLDSVPWKAALRIEREEAFLRRRSMEYGVARMVEAQVPPGKKVFAFNQVAESYTSRDIVVAYASAFGQVAGGILWTPLIPDHQPTRRWEFACEPRLVSKVRVVQTANADPDHWSVLEMRLYHGTQELRRSPEWRLRAHPNLWDVQMAFDNSPLTRWSSWQAATPGMYVEVDLGGPRLVDRVTLECPRDQYRVRMRLERMEPDERWRQEADEPRELVVEPPDLRRTATADLKAAGIDYLLIWDQDFGAEDFRRRAKSWNVELAGEYRGARLYRIGE